MVFDGAEDGLLVQLHGLIMSAGKTSLILASVGSGGAMVGMQLLGAGNVPGKRSEAQKSPRRVGDL